MKSLALFLLRLSFGSLIMVHGFPKLFGGPSKKASPTTERYLGTSFTQSFPAYSITILQFTAS